jgi:nucleotide-binding universal stress UspA family protein
VKVLIPVDGTQQSLLTLKMAGQLLDKEQSEIYLLTVRVPLATDIPWVQIDDTEVLRALLSNAEKTAVDAGLTITNCNYVTHPIPAVAICNYAEDIGAQLIVIGSHGHQGLAKLLMGSVSQDVFKLAKQPVIVVRNDQNGSIEISHFNQSGLKPAVI